MTEHIPQIHKQVQGRQSHLRVNCRSGLPAFFASFTYFLFLNSLLFRAQESCIHQICSCGNDPSPAGMMITHLHPRGEWMVSYRLMDMKMSGALSGLAGEKGPSYLALPAGMRMNMHMLMGMYGLNQRLTLMAMLQYRSSQMNMSMPYGAELHQHYMKSKGLGDSWVYALYNLYSRKKIELLLFAGAGLPTGSINQKGEVSAMMFPGKRLPYSMQNGAGSAQLNAGVNLLYSYDDLTFGSQASMVFSPLRNVVGYKTGNIYNVTGWAAWQWCAVASSSVRLDASSFQKIRGKDPSLDLLAEPGADTRNYGGAVLTAFAGLNLQPKKTILSKQHRFSLELGLPFIQRLNGIQLPAARTIVFAWSVKI